MFDARKELLGLKTSGLENIIISPLTPLRAPVTSQAHLPAAYHVDANPCFKANDSEVFTNCSGSSVGYYSSEEADQFLAQKPSSVISPIQRPSPRSSPGSSTSGHFSDSMLGSDVNNRKMSLSPSNSIEGKNIPFVRIPVFIYPILVIPITGFFWISTCLRPRSKENYQINLRKDYECFF